MPPQNAFEVEDPLRSAFTEHLARVQGISDARSDGARARCQKPVKKIRSLHTQGLSGRACARCRCRRRRWRGPACRHLRRTCRARWTCRRLRVRTPCTHAGNVDACVPTRTSLGPSCRGRRWTCRGRRWRGPACRRRVLARTSPGRACPRWVRARLAAPRRRRERRLCARADTLVRATLRSLRLAKVVAPYRAWPSARRQGGCGTRTPTPSSGRCQVAARLRPLRLSKVAAPHPSSAFGRSGRHPVAALRPLRLSKVAAPHPSCAGRRKGAARAPQGRRKGAAVPARAAN